MPPNPATLTPVRRQDISRTADYRQTSSAAAVLQAALDHGPVARSTVARLAGLSPAAVSRLCAGLDRAGLVRDAPETATNKGVGRPRARRGMPGSAGPGGGARSRGRSPHRGRARAR